MKNTKNFEYEVHCVRSVQMRTFFWSVYSCIRTEYRDLLLKSPYSVQIQENTDQKKLRIWTLFTQYYIHQKQFPTKYILQKISKC